MRHRRSRSVTPAEWPSSIHHIIRAAERECPRGHADAIAELTAIAARKIPARGIFDPAIRGEDDLFAAIDSVAHAHLDAAAARSAWHAALEAAALTFERRDDIERASLQMRAVSDTAYFYAGLSFGLAAAWMYRAG